MDVDPAESDEVEPVDDSYEIDALSILCPSCSLPAEFPDCTNCGHRFDIPRIDASVSQHTDAANQETYADRLSIAVPDELRRMERWLLWKRVPQTGKKDRKIPTYVSGVARHGEQGSPDDRASMATFDQALQAFRRGVDYAGIGLAMLGDNVTALDFDQCIDESGTIDPEVFALIGGTYSEISPSGRGIRAFFRGTMPDRKYEAGKADGIEIFSSKGFVTVTGNILSGSASDIADLTDERRNAINSRLGRDITDTCDTDTAAQEAFVDAQTITDLRSALNAIRADDRADWVYIGQCLRAIGDRGRELWLTWSQLSEKYIPADAARVWASLSADAKYGIAGVFAKAKLAGWVNPAQGRATSGQVSTPPPWSLAATQARSFVFVHASELLKPVRMRWLIDRYIEANTSGLLFGVSTAGKSFLALDWACCIATGTPWHSHPVAPGAVFVIAGEGHAGIGRRLRAWEIHYSVALAPAPLFVSELPAALISAASAEAVRAAVQALVELHGKPALIVVDTLARNLGAGDESSAADIGAYVANLDALRSALACTMLTVHHSGHAAQDRARGSSALKAAVDHEFRLELNGEQRVLTCTKAKDSEPPPPLPMALKTLTLEGWAFDGEEEPTSCVLEPDEGEAKAVRSGRKRLTGANRIALDALKCTLQKEGIAPDDALSKAFGIRAPIRVVHEDHWRQRCYNAGISDGDQAAKQKAFVRAKRVLGDDGYLQTWNDHHWFTLPP